MADTLQSDGLVGAMNDDNLRIPADNVVILSKVTAVIRAV